MITENEAVAYLKKAFPAADRVQLDEEVLTRVARHALAVRAEVPWGNTIPDDIFQAFVLFPRVNNEDPEPYHAPIWAELKPRLQGKDMLSAALEVSYWSCERATYQSTDGRTANALTVLTRTFGRCGEESTLLVSAFRACGIPARQVYVPRWSHCDDNHAWVEVWVDGVWHYLGACEPEPVLDSGWFTAAASKAMLVHTRCYGLIPKDEEIASVEDGSCVLNCTASYAATGRMRVRVTEGGKPLSGVTVRFELANMAELYPIHTGTTDENGEVSLLTGLGTLHLHVTDGERCICADADLSRKALFEIDFGRAAEFETEQTDFDQHAPAETRIQPAEYPENVKAKHLARLKECERLRAGRAAAFDHEDMYLKQAFGNAAEVRAFLNDAKYTEADRKAVLDTLRFKDFADITADVLRDALDVALRYRGDYPEAVWRESVLAPRIANEMLYPDRAVLAELYGPLETAEEVRQTLEEKLTLCVMEPRTLIPRLGTAAKKGIASMYVRVLLFVAVCRANGIAARLDPATAEPEIWYDGAYHRLFPARRTDAVLRLTNEGTEPMRYGVHFSVAQLENGVYHTLDLWDTELKDTLEIPVSAGHYRVITVRRQINGAVDGRSFPVEVRSGETKAVSVRMRPDRIAEMRLDAELPPLKAGDALLPDGRAELIALIAPGEEPTEHLLNELLEAKDEIAEKKIAVRLLIDPDQDAENAKLRKVLAELNDISLLTGADRAALRVWRERLNAGELRLPLACAADSKGRGQFAFIGYHVGSVRSLLDILSAE